MILNAVLLNQKSVGNFGKNGTRALCSLIYISLEVV